MGKDQDGEVEDNGSTMEPVLSKGTFKEVMTLNTLFFFFWQYEKTTLELFTMARKDRDEIQRDINFKKKQTVIGMSQSNNIMQDLYKFFILYCLKSLANY